MPGRVSAVTVRVMATIGEPDLSAYELERGKPAPSVNHARIQPRLIGALVRYADRFDILSELDLRLGGNDYTPNISLFPAQDTDWRHDQIRVQLAPVLAVEILSAMHGFHSIVDKLDAYFAHGTKSCWVVQPGLKTLTIFHAPDDSATHDRGVVQDSALEIEVDLDALFS